MSDQVPLDVQNQVPSGNNGNSFQLRSAAEDSGPLTGEPHQDTEMTSEDSAARDRLEEMEKETAKLRELHSKLAMPGLPEDEETAAKEEADAKSIYIGNVDYATTPLELQQHFSESGTVERVTIMTNKATGQPKGFAYLEFLLVDGANKAVATQDGSLFRERELKVSLKRTNIPGIGGRGRGRGRGRGGFRARGFRGRGMFRGGGRFNPY